jgi:hypothetical protein
MVTSNANQRRLFNGSVDFNQTDTIANRYLREIKSSTLARVAGGSVSPTHPHTGNSMIMEGFTERAFDNLNQTVKLTLGNSSQLLNPNMSSRSHVKRALGDVAKKRDQVAKSSIESHRQYSSPIPGDRAHIMPSQIEKPSG